MREPRKIGRKAVLWIESGASTPSFLAAELVKMLIMSVPPVKRSLVYAIMSIAGGARCMLEMAKNIDDLNIKEEILFPLNDAFTLGAILPMEGMKQQDVIDEFEKLSERQALGLLYGCALILDSDNMQWETVFDIDDEQDLSKQTTDALDV